MLEVTKIDAEYFWGDRILLANNRQTSAIWIARLVLWSCISLPCITCGLTNIALRAFAVAFVDQLEYIDWSRITLLVTTTLQGKSYNCVITCITLMCII